MSQPPPPPSQQPSGQSGYGYPPTPPPGQPAQGGAPTPPPGQPTAEQISAAPTQISAAPTPPPGQPPPPPGQQPSGQSGYGYPPTPPPGQPTAEQVSAAPTQISAAPTQVSAAPTQFATPPPGAPGGVSHTGQVPHPPSPRRSWGKVVGVVAVVLVVVLAAGGITMFVLKDDKGGSSKADSNSASSDDRRSTLPAEPIDGSLAWQAEAPKPAKGTIRIDTPGTWFVGGNVVRALPNGVTAYDAKTGEEAWSLDLPRSQGCANALTASKNKTAVMYGKYCDRLTVVDLTNGQKVWDIKLPETGDRKLDYKASSTSLAVSGDLVALQWFGGYGAGWRLESGEQVWAGQSKGSCILTRYTGGRQLIAFVRCTGAEKETYALRGLAPDGTVEWEWQAPAGVKVTSVLSDSPLLVAVRARGREISDVMYLNNGRLVQKIRIDPNNYEIKCNADMSWCPGVVADRSYLYLPTKRHRGKERSDVNEVAAIDLKSGQPKWRAEPEQEGQVKPVAVQDGRLLVYCHPGYQKPGVVYAYDVRTRKSATMMRLSADGARVEQMMYLWSVPLWHDDALYLSGTEILENSFVEKQYAVAAFTG